jgi:IclR family transcriptional regulator, acetate operon repressor
MIVISYDDPELIPGLQEQSVGAGVRGALGGYEVLVRQAANVLDLMEYFAQVKKPANLAEISAALGWPRSSTFNLLSTLAQRGYLYEPRPRAGLYPTSRWTWLLRDIADPKLLPVQICRAADEVARLTEETVAIAAPSGASAVLLYVVESPHVVRFTAQVGFQMPIHITACGRALLAQYSPAERAAALKKVQYQKLAARSLLDAKQVEAEIKRAAARGWHENVDGYATDLVGVALPIGLPDRCLSIVVGGPTSRMRQHIPQIAATLKRELNRCTAAEL